MCFVMLLDQSSVQFRQDFGSKFGHLNQIMVCWDVAWPKREGYKDVQLFVQDGDDGGIPLKVIQELLQDSMIEGLPSYTGTIKVVETTKGKWADVYFKLM